MKLLNRVTHAGNALGSKDLYERIGEMRAKREASGRGIGFGYRDEAGRAVELRRTSV